VPANESFDFGPNDSFSIELWFKKDATTPLSEEEVFVGRDDEPLSSLHWWVGLWTGGEAAFVLRDRNNSAVSLLGGSSDLTDGEWHHVVVVRDSDLGQTRLYVDGVLNDSVDITYTTGFDSATAALNLGWLNLDSGYNFGGSLDEVAIYNKWLSEEEIAEHYNSGAGGSYCGTLARYTLTVSTSGSGSVSPGGGVYHDGQALQLTPTPEADWAFNGWSGDLSGYSNPATVVMDGDKTISADFAADSDGDGASDEQEDAAPNSGDGDNSGTDDKDEANVASFLTHDGLNIVTLVSPDPTTLSLCSAVTPPSGAPADTEFPWGFVSFNINLENPGDAVQASLILPDSANPEKYYRYGPTPDDSADHWYEFAEVVDEDGTTGAQISGNQVALNFVDGARGDDDLQADGIIVDAGGPSITPVVPPAGPTVDPAQGTVGTEFTITDQGFGDKKGKVLIGTQKCKVLEWTDTTISCLLKKAPSAGTYDVTIQPKGKGIVPVVIGSAFEIMDPDIETVSQDGNSVTLEGSFFSNKKVKAYLVVDGNGTRKKMKVISLNMDPSTGISQLVAEVRNKVLKKLESGSSYDIVLENKVGSDTEANGFTAP